MGGRHTFTVSADPWQDELDAAYSDYSNGMIHTLSDYQARARSINARHIAKQEAAQRRADLANAIRGML